MRYRVLVWRGLAAGLCGLLVGCGGSSPTESSATASGSGSGSSAGRGGPGQGAPVGSGSATASVRVRCEKRVPPRDPRSKISVDGNDLAPGTYRARVTSDGNQAVSGEQPTVGDEVEFDFDSNTEPGATVIAPGFIQGMPGAVTGQILSGGSVVAEATVTCELKR